MAPEADPELTTESAAIALGLQVRVAALPSRRVWGTPLQKGFWSYMSVREGCPGNLEMLVPLMPKRKFSQKNGPCTHTLLGAGAQLSPAGMEQHFLAHRLQKPLSPHMQTCPVSKTSKTHWLGDRGPAACTRAGLSPKRAGSGKQWKPRGVHGAVPCLWIISTRMSITMMVPVRPIPALEREKEKRLQEEPLPC